MEALFFNDQKFYDFDEASEYFEDQIGRLNLELSKSKETLECTVRNHSQETKELMKSLKEKTEECDYVSGQLAKEEENSKKFIEQCFAKDEEIKDLNAEIYLLQQKIEHKNEKIRKLEKSMSKLIIKFLK